MEWYERFISGLQKQLEEAEFGSERYYKVLDILSRVQEMKLKEEKVVNDAVEEYNRSEAARKSERKRFWLDMARVSIPVIGSLAMLCIVIAYEQSGHLIPQRLIALVAKPKI